MIEGSRKGIYEKFNPFELNEEMRQIYDLLPTQDIFHLPVDSIKWDPVQGIIDHRTDEEKIRDREKLNAALDARRSSELTHVLRTNHTDLLTFSVGTPSSRIYIQEDFENLLIYGVDRKPIIGLSPQNLSDHDIYYRRFRWSPNEGGIFVREIAQRIEQVLYRGLYERELWGMEIDEELSVATEDTPIFGKLIKHMNDYRDQEKLLDSLRSEEELDEKRKNQKEVDQKIDEYIHGKKRLLMRWRTEFISLYGDEP